MHFKWVYGNMKGTFCHFDFLMSLNFLILFVWSIPTIRRMIFGNLLLPHKDRQTIHMHENAALRRWCVSSSTVPTTMLTYYCTHRLLWLHFDSKRNLKRAPIFAKKWRQWTKQRRKKWVNERKQKTNTHTSTCIH